MYIPIIAALVVGAVAGLEHFHWWAVMAGSIAVAASALRLNWVSVIYAIEKDHGPGERPFWDILALAALVFVFFTICASLLQIPGYLLLSWLHPVSN
jgi:hypothetical protein